MGANDHAKDYFLTSSLGEEDKARKVHGDEELEK